MWVGVGVGVGAGVGVDFYKPESESESESLKFGRLRSPGSNIRRRREESYWPRDVKPFPVVGGQIDPLPPVFFRVLHIC